jgi:hypothetical protein
MVAPWRSLTRPRSILNPVTRVAVATFLWAHRHEILRWGRSLYEQLIRQADRSPARAMRTGRLLYVIASDDQLRDAQELRKVSLDGDVVDLEVADDWGQLTRLLHRVRSVKGIRGITVNGRPVPEPRGVIASTTTSRRSQRLGGIEASGANGR